MQISELMDETLDLTEGKEIETLEKEDKSFKKLCKHYDDECKSFRKAAYFEESEDFSFQGIFSDFNQKNSKRKFPFPQILLIYRYFLHIFFTF